jgi:RNA polymerase sigma-70 factor, ECF subfamily
MHQDEKQLILLLKQGNEKAFTMLFSLYHARVYNLARKFLSLKEDAEEVLQTVFIAIWENRQQIDEERSFASYILTITKHWVFNTIRKSVYRQGYLDYLVRKGDPLDFVTEDEIQFNDLNTLIQKLISKLPPKRREIFILSRIDGLSYKDIAGQLGITESTVNTQLSKAIEYFRSHIQLLY